MNWISVNENGPEGSCRASVLTCSATDADLIPYFGYEKASFIRYHMASLCRAVFRTGSASRFLSMNNAVFLNKDGLPDLGEFLGFRHQGHYRSGWADIGTPCAVIIAEAAVEIHPWLHYPCKSVLTGRRLEYISWAGIDTQGACSTPGGENLDA